MATGSPINIFEMFPKECLDEKGNLSLKKFSEHSKHSYTLADQIAAASDVTYEKRKTIFLMDVQGVYLAVLEWMREHDIPIEDGDLLGHITFHLLTSTIKKVEKREEREFVHPGLSYEELYKLCFDKKEDELREVKVVTRLENDLELFFAPFPLERIKAQLSREFFATKNRQIQSDINQINEGNVRLPWGTRNYKFYDKFVADLANAHAVKRQEKGFFSFRVEDQGLKYIDEKEVDIRIAIRAMDIMAGGEADAVCIVSSDQDFMPLHERCRDAGLRTYHADLAKFGKQWNIGRKIKELGDDAVQIEMPIDFPWMLVQEYVTTPKEYQILTPSQYHALWRLHCEWHEDPYVYQKVPD